MLWRNKQHNNPICLKRIKGNVMSRRKKKTDGQVIDESLMRMQKYLERKGIASSICNCWIKQYK